MIIKVSRGFKYCALAFAILAVAGIAAAAWRTGALPLGEWWNKLNSSAEAPSGDRQTVPAKLAGKNQQTLELSAEVSKFIGVGVEEVRAATQARKLMLDGSLALSPERLSHVRARFPGEVVEVAKMPAGPEATLQTLERQIRFGDHVAKGQVLAVIWSADLGSKKNDLIDAIAQLRFDQKQLQRSENLYKESAINLATLENARTTVEKDRNLIARAERTLRSLRVTEDEIEAVKKEAAQLLTDDGKRDKAKEPKNWARVDVTAPLDGVIVEKNFLLGELVDNSFDLFKIADLDKLNVLAHVYEEDLKALQSLKPDELYWTIHVEADPTARFRRSKIEVIGPVIDPLQHTAVVMGEIDNPRHLLHAAQFVTATVDLPPAPGEVVIPTTALMDDGRESTIFVKLDPRNIPDADAKKDYYEQRRVFVTRREQTKVYLRSELSSQEIKKGLQTVKPGELIVKEGAIILESTLEDLQTESKKS
jgi:membrane fusion protein, heavy metal efflux system